MEAATRRGDRDDLVVLLCITFGAVIGFTLTGGAAIGTAVGAAGGIGLIALHRVHSRG